MELLNDIDRDDKQGSSGAKTKLRFRRDLPTNELFKQIQLV